MNNITLYRHALSGHAHRVENFLSILNIPTTLVDVDLMGGEHLQPAFQQKNHFTEVPVIEDGDITLSDSNAILVYLATKYDDSRTWLPTNPNEAAEIQRFLSIAAGPIAFGVAKARLINVFGIDEDPAAAIEIAHSILASLNAFLQGRQWFVTEHPTIADITLYSYIAHAPEGNVSLSDYSNITRWLSDVENIKNFIPMQKTKVGFSAE
ncbi:MAG: glutathione S-transferase [Methylococcales bacterium]|nr:glutathione S-transferase [Methylococcales bacterium]MBT7445465.1 glutathione S-transferase [Methylococcales bacterium]